MAFRLDLQVSQQPFQALAVGVVTSLRFDALAWAIRRFASGNLAAT